MRGEDAVAGHTVAQSRDKRSRELLEARGSRATAPKLPEIVAFFCFPVIRRMLRRSMSFLPVPVTRKAPTDLAPAPSSLVHDFSSFALPSRIRVRRTVRGSRPGFVKWIKKLYCHVLFFSIFFSILPRAWYILKPIENCCLRGGIGRNR